MTDKAYIVANEEQEREVLENYDKQGKTWCSGTNLLRYSPSEYFMDLPYVIYEEENGLVYDNDIYLLAYKDFEIVYDGRKESEMKISQEVYDALNGWLQGRDLDTEPISGWDMFQLPQKVDDWIMDVMTTPENNNRLIAIIRWVNGEDVFEVEEPKKWIVRSKKITEYGDHGYVMVNKYGVAFNRYKAKDATKFDTKEEAESWANSHQEVIEVEE